MGGDPTLAAPADAVHRLSEQQRRIATWGAAAAAAAFVAVWAPSYPAGHAVGFTGIGLAAAGLLYLAARRGSVLLTAIAAFLVSFGPWSFYWALGLPYLAGAGVLLFRASKRAVVAPREPKAAPPKAAAPSPAPLAQRRPPRESKRYTPPAAGKKRR